MKKRTSLILIGIAILLVGVALAAVLKSQKEPPKRIATKVKAKAVQTFIVKNDSVLAKVAINGPVKAANRIELYAEVSGVLQSGSHPFKAGIPFKKGEILLKIDADEAWNNLRSQKSILVNSITQILPDLKLDYPESYGKWKSYLDNFRVDQSLSPFPEPENEKVKYFLTSRNIYNQYYTIKSMESRLGKYIIRAPFDGIVTQSSIDPGTLVRGGQKLGEFIDPSAYEMEAAVSLKDLDIIHKGDSAHIRSSDISGKWKGKVIRINDRIDPTTQTVKIFLSVMGNKLKEGLYLDGVIYGTPVSNAMEIKRKLIMDDSLVWAIQDTVLVRKKVEVIHYSLENAIVKGLKNNTVLLASSFPGAFEGMYVVTTEKKENGKKQ